MKIPNIIKPGNEYKKRFIKPSESATEVETARGWNSKLFNLGNNKYRLVAGGQRLHYFDGAKLQDIDLSFVETKKGFTCDTAPYRLLVYKDKVGYEYNSRISGRVVVKLETVAGQAIGAVTAVVDGNKITYTNVVSGLDFVLALKENEVEFFKVLRDTNTPRTWVWNIQQEIDGVAKFNAKTFGVDANNNAVRVNGVVGDERVVGKHKTFTYTETWTGEVSRISDKVFARRQRDWFSDPAYPVTIDVSTSDDITTTNDDGKELANYAGWYSAPYSTYSDNIWGYPVPPTAAWHGGLRFQTVNIPQGATINTATITLQVTAIYGTAPIMKVYADDVDDAAAWSNTSRPSQITKTTALTTWQETTTGARTIDVASIVQEIVNRAGWVANNDIRFALINTVGIINQRVLVKDLKAGATQDAVLACDYTASGTSVKTVNGLAEASVKTKLGLANASVKTFQGLA